VSGKFVNDNTLSVYIKRIREKIGCEDIIKTIKGIGYRIDL
jgi:DNA-binding response OmpR family regulator